MRKSSLASLAVLLCCHICDLSEAPVPIHTGPLSPSPCLPPLQERAALAGLCQLTSRSELLLTVTTLSVNLAQHSQILCSIQNICRQWVFRSFFRKGFRFWSRITCSLAQVSLQSEICMQHSPLLICMQCLGSKARVVNNCDTLHVLSYLGVLSYWGVLSSGVLSLKVCCLTGLCCLQVS